jgi:predicted Zn-dependent peptidase
MLFYIHKRKSLQSNIYFHINGEKYRNEKDRATQYCFNEYFGDGMYSIIFQEIREFRSLGYAVRSFYNYAFLNKEKGYLYGFLSTQSDKTIEGINAMRQLMTDMPKKNDKFATARESLLHSQSANYIGFRTIPETVRQWLQQGYQQDPRHEIMNIIETTTLNDVSEFFDYNIKGKPIIVSLSGNMKKVNKKELSKFGKIKKLKVKDVMKR